MVDYGSNRLEIVHRHFGTGNTPAASFGLTCMSKQTGMEGTCSYRIPIREAEWVRNEPIFWHCFIGINAGI